MFFMSWLVHAHDCSVAFFVQLETFIAFLSCSPIITVGKLLYFVDSIEANVDSAAVHVEDANVQLHKASNYQVLAFYSFVILLCYFAC